MEGDALYFFDQAANRARGPYPLTQIVEFAETTVINIDTLVAPTGRQEWTAIRDWPELCELLFPEAHLHLRAEAYQAAPEADAEYESDAYAVLAVNRAQEDPDKVIFTDEQLRPKMSRRLKDYLWGIFGVNLLLILGAGLYTLIFGVNVVVVIFALSGMIIWSIGLTWVTFFVMDSW